MGLILFHAFRAYCLPVFFRVGFPELEKSGLDERLRAAVTPLVRGEGVYYLLLSYLLYSGLLCLRLSCGCLPVVLRSAFGSSGEASADAAAAARRLRERSFSACRWSISLPAYSYQSWISSVPSSFFVDPARPDQRFRQLFGVSVPLSGPRDHARRDVDEAAGRGVVEGPQPERDEQPHHVRRLDFELVSSVEQFAVILECLMHLQPCHGRHLLSVVVCLWPAFGRLPVARRSG